LPLAIPVFVRSRDEKGKEFLEFATALNVSAGGALVAVRRSLPPTAQVLLEIPPVVEWSAQARWLPKETWFCGVKRFSYPQSNFRLVPRPATRALLVDLVPA